MIHVVGVDGCRSGWCAVSIRDEENGLTVSPPVINPSFRDVVASKAKVICIDIPIGLLDGPGRRACDAEARNQLGRRASVVFTPPCRAALSIEDYWEASAANFRVTGRMLSKQAYGIRRKIREVDSGMTPDRQALVHEVHPELCFWALNDHEPALSNKKRLAGRHERWQSLRTVLPLQPEPPRPRDLPHACAVDDYIDALVAAWTAVCISRGSAQRIPSQPEMDEKGLRMEMWFPAV